MLEDKEKHLKFRIWVSVICMVCLCGCSSAGEKPEIEVTQQPVILETHTKALSDKQILSFSLTQPVSEGYSVAYEGNCVINADGTLDRENEVTVFTSIMKENTVLANDTKHIGIANIDSNLTIQDENTLLLITTVHYDDPDGDVTFHYLEHMTLAVKQNKGTYHIEIIEVTMA